MKKTLSLFPILMLALLTTFSLQVTANSDHYTTVSKHFDHLLWSQDASQSHIYPKVSYTLMTIDNNGLVSSNIFNTGLRMTIRGHSYTIRKVDLYFDLQENDRPFYSCKIDLEGEERLYCSIHVSGIKALGMKRWNKTETDILGGTKRTSGISHVIH